MVGLQARAGARDAAVKWSVAAPGVQWARVRMADGNGGTVLVTAVRASAKHLHIATGATLQARAWRTRERAVAAANGGYFDNEGRSLGLRVSGGVKRTRMHLTRWGVFYVTADRARILDAKEYAAATRGRKVAEAVQCGPVLVANGRTAKLKPQTARRTGIGVDRQGHVVLAVADGGARLDAWARLWANQLGCPNALNLDGGPSTQLSLRTADAEAEVDGGWGTPDAVVIR